MQKMIELQRGDDSLSLVHEHWCDTLDLFLDGPNWQSLSKEQCRRLSEELAYFAEHGDLKQTTGYEVAHYM